jgi:hypothetical protein
VGVVARISDITDRISVAEEAAMDKHEATEIPADPLSTPACRVRSWGAPGKRVCIKATGFLPDDAVYFGTLPADHVVLDAARGRLRATVPAGATSANVWVTSTTGLTASSPNGFRIR